MEFKKLEQNKRSKIIICFTVLILLLITIVLMVSKAKYQVTKNVQIVNGTVSYTPYDFKIVKIYKENNQGKYEETTGVPEGEYEIDEEESKCMIDDNQQDTGAILKTIDGNHTFANLKKMDKCTLYFSKIKIIGGAFIIDNSNVINTQPDFSKTACDEGTNNGSDCGSTDKGLYKAVDDDGATYYFRGSVNNNWVKFAGYYWRIIRINGDSSIRMIYTGKVGDENSLTFPDENKTNPVYVTGNGTQVTISGSIAFNTSNNQNRYIGYMYGNSYSNYNESHKNDAPSNIKQKLESWYSDNLANVSVGGKTAKDYIDTDAGFCGDRTPYNGMSSSSSIDYSKGGNKTQTYYGAYHRLVAQKNPDLRCKRQSGSGSTTLLETNDLYTVSTSKKGNKVLVNPVGLISADEATFVGGKSGSNNQGYYLYTNQDYWTMSPAYFNGSNAQVFYMNLVGNLNYYRVSDTYGVRPVINLKADTKFTFTRPNQPNKGTFSNPYIVK